jgi:K+-sensing histidine kinase KdpD
VGLQTLVDNLLETARMEAGHFSINPQPAELGDIIAETTRLLEPLLLKYQQRLVLELPSGPLRVHADARRIVQVLINLLSNASNYGPADWEIVLRAARRGMRSGSHGGSGTWGTGRF